MLARLLAKRAWTHFALAGLIFGVAVLAAVTMLSTVTTRRAIVTVEISDQISATWNDVFVDINQEIDVLDDYQLMPDAVSVDQLQSHIASAEPSLIWLTDHVNSSEAARLRLIADTYRNVVAGMRAVVTAASEDRRTEAMTKAAETQAIAVGLSKQVIAASAVHRFQFKSDLEKTNRENQRLNTIGRLTVLFDAVLLTICAFLLLGFQRHIVRFAHSSQHQARHDPLTGLGNRMLFDEELGRAVERAQSTGVPVALLLMDLDGFKGVNDSLGHQAGDILLRHIAARLPLAVRRSDVVARLGGDEFAAILSGIGSIDNASAVANKVLDAVQQPADLDGTMVDVTASIGVSLFPVHSADAQQLLQHADIAMYTAKRHHLGVAVYADSADRQSPRQIALLGELRRAIEHQELVLHYQPKIDARTREVIGAEALVRWQHPEHGLLGPGDFIPLAEQSELMNRLTEHVIGRALRQSRDWLLDGWRVPVAVNVGARCLLDLNFPAMVERQLTTHELPADMLTLEITETSLISDPTQAREGLTVLRELGLSLSIDDFGTGYSSMTYLITLPVQEIKIDRSFVSSMLSEASHRQVVQAIVGLGLSLGLEVVAEGVEDEETWAQLIAWQCSTGQGYHLGRPVSAPDFGHWLTGHMKRSEGYLDECTT